MWSVGAVVQLPVNDTQYDETGAVPAPATEIGPQRLAHTLSDETGTSDFLTGLRSSPAISLTTEYNSLSLA